MNNIRLSLKPNHSFFRTVFLFLVLFVFSTSVLAQQICDANRKRSTLIKNFQLTSSGFTIQTYYNEFAKMKAKRYWTVCSLGQMWTGLDCAGEKKQFNFEEASSVVSSLRYAGFDDWRLPTVNEMRSIVEWQCESPAVDQLLFPGIDYYPYWTSDKPKGRANIAWVMDFATGQVMYANINQKRFIIAIREE